MSSAVAIITNALTDMRIAAHNGDSIKDSLAVMVQTLFATAGQVPGKNDVILIIKELSHDLKTRYKTLTLPEVKIALNNGIRGEYGDYFGINVVSINKWLKGYCMSDERKEAMRNKISAELPALPQSVACNPCNTGETAARHAFEKYKKEGKVYDYGHVAYDYLDSCGLIPFSDKEKYRMMELAEKQIKDEAKNFAKNFVTLKAIIDKIADNQIIMRAKRIALNKYFEMKISEENKKNKKNGK